MIVTLNINNFALIEKLRLDLSPGLNVFTGETGAGKSLIIQAFSLLLGERASSSVVRKGCKTASVEASFNTGTVSLDSLLDKWGVSIDDEDNKDFLLIGREVSSVKKGSSCFVNGRMTVLKVLKEVGNELVDLHGQHEHQALMKSAKHLHILDTFGGKKHRRDLDNALSLVCEFREKLNELRELKARERERGIEIDNLLFQMHEIDDIAPQSGEDEKLQSNHRLLANSDRLKNLACKLEQLVTSDKGVVELLRSGWNNLDEICEFSDQAKEIRTNYQEALFLLEEVGSSFSSLSSAVVYDEEELKNIEDRIGKINGLVRKYGPSLENVIDYRIEIGQRYQELKNADKILEESDKDIAYCKSKVGKAVGLLSEKRHKIALKLAKAVNKELKFLEMAEAVFSVNLSHVEIEDSDESIVLSHNDDSYKLFSDGIDRCEFVVAANKGEKAGPLAKVASGGEVSRIMLAIKSALANSDSVPIMVFDEIDTGIGGETGWAVARKLYEVSRSCQCLCITHLPQIAAFADGHFNVSKSGVDNRTVISVSSLDEDGRVIELSRMLGGTSPSSLSHAKEFLEVARTDLKE